MRNNTYLELTTEWDKTEKRKYVLNNSECARNSFAYATYVLYIIPPTSYSISYILNSYDHLYQWPWINYDQIFQTFTLSASCDFKYNVNSRLTRKRRIRFVILFWHSTVLTKVVHKYVCLHLYLTIVDLPRLLNVKLFHRKIISLKDDEKEESFSFCVAIIFLIIFEKHYWDVSAVVQIQLER